MRKSFSARLGFTFSIALFTMLFTNSTLLSQCASGTISGHVFTDANNNGLQDLWEDGQSGFQVRLYDGDGNWISQSISDASGEFTISGLVDGSHYRLEYTVGDNLQISNLGPNNRGDVQFVSAPYCDADLGILSIAGSCSSETDIFLTCFVNGQGSDSPNQETIIGLSSDFNATSPVQAYARQSETGAVWGLVHDENTQQIFSAAFVKQHASLGPNGLGAIYRTNINGPSTQLHADLSGLGINVGSLSITDSEDCDYGVQVGKIGLGGLTADDDVNHLFVANLYNNTIVRLSAINPTAATTTSYQVPDPGCADGDYRVFGVKYYGGSVYVGVTCTGESSGSEAATSMHVYAMNPATGAFSLVFGNAYSSGYWSNANIDSRKTMQWLTDIDFTVDGKMILALSDRIGHAYCDTSSSRIDDQFGDILLVEKVNGVWVLENNGSVASGTGTGVGNGEGPGGGEFFGADYFPGNPSDHPEVALGSVYVRPGSGEVISAVFDPSVSAYSGGLHRYSTTTGDKTGFRELYNQNISDYFGKATGFGDIDAGCGPAAPQIGNYVWIDSDGDGIQDAGEPALTGATVHLYDAQCNLLNSVQTDSQGNYSFTQGISTGTQYYVALDPSAFVASAGYTFGSTVYNPTVTSPSGQLNSDLTTAHSCTSLAGLPLVSVVPTGANNISFDIGLQPSTDFDLALTKINTTPNRHRFGDVIEFEIEVFNQGSIAAAEFEVVDYLSAAYEFDASLNSGWVYTNGMAKKRVTTPLLPGQSHKEIIKLRLIGSGNLDDYINYAEISYTLDANGNQNSDMDSNTDDNRNNDAGGVVDSDSDNMTNGTGAIDEDDHDPAMVYLFDLALSKVARSNRAYNAGETVTFDIAIINQGNVDASGFEVADSYPEGLSFDPAQNPNWVASGDQRMVYYNYGETLAVGEQITISIDFTIEASSAETQLMNYAEISSFTSSVSAITEDFDSHADSDMFNDVGGDPYESTDNMVADHAVIDEDDHDPAGISIVAIDLALIKTVAATSFDLGDKVIFELEVHNQGTSSIGRIELVDYLPEGMTLVDEAWTLDATGKMATKVVDFLSGLAPNDVYTDYIKLVINEDSRRGAYLNVAEISQIYDRQSNNVSASDIDSNADSVRGNDAGGQAVTAMDDYLLGDGFDDEDDSDPALIFVPSIALTESCVCLNNATNSFNGQFREEIAITAISGETWHIDSEFEFYSTVSTPGSLVSYPTGPSGQTFIERPNGDGTSTYILRGVSANNNEYTLRATNGSGVYLSVAGGGCSYVSPIVTGDGLGAVCANSQQTYSVDTSDPAFADCTGYSWFLSAGTSAGTIVNMPGTNATGSGTGMTGSGTGLGNSVTIDWGATTGSQELILIPHCPNDCAAPVSLEIQVGTDDAAMSCVHEINVSLGTGCQSTLEPEDLLTSELTASVAYQLILTDPQGNVIQGNVITEANLWTTLMAKVMNPCSGNSCWATVNVEDKLAPQIQCDDIEVKCYQLHNYEPIVLDNCSTSEYRMTSESTTPLTCADPYVSTVFRTYVAEDGYGNISAPCTQRLNVLRIDLDAIEIPENFTVIDENALSCLGLVTDESGNPHPDLTGVPTIEGNAIYPVSDLDCNIGVEYNDFVVADFGCSKKIMRTWTIYDGCNDPLRKVQTIEIADIRAPWVECPTNVTINTDGSPGCDAPFTFEIPAITDDCTTDNFRIDVAYAGGFIENLEAGTSVILSSSDDTEIKYNIYDQCENLTTCVFNVTVLDNVSPTAICDRNSVVSLRLDGTAKAFPQTFDDGSYDDCNLFKTLVRRMDSSCDCDRPKYADMKYLGERNGRLYYLSSYERTPFKASTLATAYGGSLLTLESEGEHAWVYEQVNEYSAGEPYLIGLQDKTGNGEFTWSNHAAPSFYAWASNLQRNNGTSVFVNANGEWETVADTELRFVLEISNPCAFSEEVAFCCADVGEESMVVLRAIDYFGGFNDCMVNVEVQDKVPPVLACPSDIVLDCAASVDPTNLSQYGTATASDSCLAVIEVEVIDERNRCGTGQLIRRFTASDNNGSSTCDQYIRFENSAPFDFSTIIRPQDFDTNLGCNFGELHPDNLPVESAYPIYPADACDIVEGTFEDQVFSFAGAGTDACLKILRTWTVVDWCQTDEDGLPLTTKFDQTIKVQNTDGPVIEEGDCAAITVETLECDNAQVTFTVEANDDCTPAAQLQNCLKIDFDSDGTFDYEDCLVSNVVSFDNKLPVGTHVAFVSFSDLCGNTTTCSKEIVVKSQKPPVAYCKSGLSVALEPMDLDGDGMPDDEMACIFPHMLDLGSNHPCGHNFGLSFCNNDPTNKITFNCTDIGTQIVTLCVVDEFGNSASCETSIEIQDNNDGDFCPEFDLAILKEAINGPAEYSAGDTVTYRITVYNQGNIDAINTTLTDYVPNGLIYDASLNTGWTGPDANGNLLFSSIPLIEADPFDDPNIRPYEIIELRLIIDPATMETCLINEVEISASGNPAFPTYPDLDSNADNIQGNDTVIDNVLNEDGLAFVDQDEDDHDIAKVNIFQSYDLALTKSITNGFTGPYAPGDAVNYTISVINEGTLDATTIDIQDNIPAGLILDDPNWSVVGNSATLNNSIPFIGVGTSQSVTINFTIDPMFMGDAILNDAQIIDRDGSDPDDVDSDTSTDKTIDEDGDGNGDDDDEDSVEISLTQVFDLALTKVVTPGGPAVYQTGDIVSFTIRVENQGTLDATGVEVTDYIRANAIYTQALGNNAANGWSAATNPSITIGDVPAGGFAEVEISVMIDPNFTGATLINDAEITNAENALGLPDEDSSPNDNSNTDSELDTDNDISDAPDNPNDSDDYDPSVIAVECTLEPICSVLSTFEVLLDENGMASIIAADIDNGSAARCEGLDVTLNLSQTDFTCADKANGAVVTVTAVDDRGNESTDATCATTITIKDEINPTITCTNITTTLDANGMPIIDLADVVVSSDDNCSIVSTVLSPLNAVGLCEVNTGTVVVTDICDNTASCTFEYSLVQQGPEYVPTCAVIPAITINLDDDGVATLDASQVDNGSAPVCPGTEITLTLSQSEFACSNKVEVVTVAATVTDEFGNVSNDPSCTVQVTVADAIAPFITCQNISTTLDADGDPIIDLNDVVLTSGDNCAIVATELSSTAGLGLCTVNTATVTVTDACGNSALCEFEYSLQQSGPEYTPTCAVIPAINLPLDADGAATLTATQVDNGSAAFCPGTEITIALSQTDFTCANKGTVVTVVATVTDEFGNVSNDPSCTVDVTVSDEIDPFITCQDISTTLDASGMPIINLADVVVTSGDNCSLASTILQPLSTIGLCEVNTGTVVVTDICDNTASCTFEYSLVQQGPEYIPTCAVIPSINLLLDADGNATLDASQVDNGSAAVCPGTEITITLSQTDFTCANKAEAVSVTATVTDEFGNVSTNTDCIVEVTVSDPIDPFVTCQGITTTLDSDGNPIINTADVILTSGDNCSIVSTEVTPPLSVDICDVNVAMITVTDQCGNTGTCTFDVSIVDQAPMAVCVDDFELCLTAAGIASLTAENIDNGSTDDCGISQLAIDQMTFDCDDVGPTTIMLSVFDNNVVPQTDQCTTVVTIVDKTPPTAICQDVTAEVLTNGNVIVTAAEVDNGSNDACGLANNPFTLSQTIYNCDDKGMATTAILTVTDANDNTSTCSAAITIVDNIAPTVTCRTRRPLDLDENGLGSIDPSFVILTSNDNCGSVNSALDISNFDCSDKETIPVVTVTVTDISGNTATCQSEILVRDRLDPTCTLLVDQVFNVIGDPPMVTIELADILDTFEDNCATAPSNVSISPNNFTCGDVGVQTVNVTMDDGCGNVTSCTTDVTIQDVNLPTCNVIPDVTVDLGANGMVTITPNMINISSTAGCDPNATLVVSPNSLACNQIPLSPIVVTLTVTASNGLSATCTSNVSVQDPIDPTVTCENALTVELGAMGTASIAATDVIITSADNCTVETSVIDVTSFDCSQKPGPIVVTATVTDGSGNTATCTTDVTLVDNAAPTCTLLANQSFDLIGTPPAISLTVADVLDTYTDNCSTTPAASSINPSDFDCSSVGPQTVVVTVTDDCGNSSTCETSVNIADTSVPVCLAQDVSVNLNASGLANVTAAQVDAGSNAGCGTNVDLSLSQTSFDCDEVGANMVVLTVTTSGGNSSTCTAIVTVNDNTPPVITCPFEPTVACDSPLLDDLDNFGFPTVTDNCTNNLGTLTENVADNTNSCGLGVITRVFIISDGTNTVSCAQEVTVVQDPAFTMASITCPADATIDGCVDLNNIYAGSPILDIPAISCVDIVIDSTLVDLSPLTTGTCVDTFEKTWTIVDNCTNNTFTCSQIIILNDGTGPEITCSDVTAFLPANSAVCEIFVNLPVTIVDTCTMGIVASNNSPFANNQNSGNAAGTYPGGLTPVTVFATDQCGNVSECSYNVTVIDTFATITNCKKIIETIQPAMPPAFNMPYGIVDTTQACISISSSCPSSVYTMSFDSLDINATTIIVDCDDAANPGGIVPGGYTIYLWAGNTVISSCNNFLQVLDGAGHCVQPIAANIVGNIATEAGEEVENVMVHLEGSNETGYMTEDNGDYAFMEVDFGESYMVVPEKDKDYLNGVSTLDLVKMQRHVLGVELLDSPYKIIAADINKSDEVNGLDLVELRKLILGLYTELPNNTSWRMVDEGHKFFDPSNPFFETIPESYIINELNQSMEIDFVGVKVGDVNQSVIANSNRKSRSLSAGQVSMKVEDRLFEAGTIVDIPVILEDLAQVDGFQYTLAIDKAYADIINIQSDVPGFSEANMNLNHLSEGRVNISWHTARPLAGISSNVMFYATVRLTQDAYASQFIGVADNGLTAEAYIMDEAYNLNIDFVDDSRETPLALAQNSPNPWSTATTIGYTLPQAQDVSFQVYDVDGRLVYVEEISANAGANQIDLAKSDLPNGGIYYYELKAGDNRLTQKMILIK